MIGTTSMLADRDRIEQIYETARRRLLEWGGRWVDKIGPSTEANPALPSAFGRTQDLFELFKLLEVEYLLPGRTGESLESLAQQVASLAEDYFFGAWRATAPNPTDLDRQWFDEFRFGMLAGSLLPDPHLFQRIIQFPTADLPHDEGGWDRTAADSQLYVALCASLRAGQIQELPAPRGQRPKALRPIIASIFGKDAKAFDKAFASYLKWYRGNEHENRGNMLICLDGSILLQVARLSGVDISATWQRDRDILLAQGP